MNAKTACIAACAAIAFIALPAPAAENEKPATQQDRLSTCAHESKGLRGEEHQHFMSECLHGHAVSGAASESQPPAASEGGQQNRMRSCNAQAREKELHGDERRAFMSACLKG